MKKVVLLASLALLLSSVIFAFVEKNKTSEKAEDPILTVAQPESRWNLDIGTLNFTINYLEKSNLPISQTLELIDSLSSIRKNYVVQLNAELVSKGAKPVKPDSLGKTSDSKEKGKTKEEKAK